MNPNIKDLSDTITTVHEVIVECKDEKEQEQIYNKLKEEGRTCRILTL